MRRIESGNNRPRVHVYYRYVEGDGNKPRPPFFSKELAVQSLMTSLERVDPGRIGAVELHVDGPKCELSPRILDRFTVRYHEQAGNAASYIRTIRAATDGRIPSDDDDIVFLAEDDYLWKPDAIPAILRLFENHPGVNAATTYDHPDYRTVPRQKRYIGRYDRGTVTEDHVSWTPVASTCMTYAARLSFLRRTLWAHEYISRRSSPDDTELWFTINRVPRVSRGLVRNALTALPSPRLWSAAIESAASCAPIGARPNLFAARPSLSTHMHEPYLPEGTDWAELARSTKPVRGSSPEPSDE